ncbi:MAG TPA: hypothetical protein GX516_01880 [Thermoanaerobacter sp.]|nr:hypothetical protein [Thermoanaerobacter sp.]
MDSARVIGRFLINGKLNLESPLLIGTGEKNYTDISVEKDDGGNPYIPASSLRGVLRHYFFDNLALEGADKAQIEYFWGSDKSRDDQDTYQSAFILEDLYALNKPSVVTRDGIKIDNKTGVAEDKKKFDYEVVEPGAQFGFNAEVVLRECFSEEIFLKIVSTLISALKNGQTFLGSMTTKGFGRCRLSEFKVYKYNFINGTNKTKDVISWLKGESREDQSITLDLNNIFLHKKSKFSLKATFTVSNSLIVRAYTGVPKEPDCIHMTSAGRDILPGTSLKGALRTRAVKIINTLGGQGDELVKELFGWASDKPGEEGKKIKSRLMVNEAYIQNSIKETQFRIKIDRFTGGVIKTALFDSTPVWSNKDNASITINIDINDCKNWEAGLLMLLLKDLWTGDLAVGGEKNIGRGTFKGQLAEIYFNKNHYIIERNKDELKINSGKDELENLVSAFVEKCKAERVKI